MNKQIDQLWGQALDLAVPETYTRLSHSQLLKIKQRQKQYLRGINRHFGI